MAASVKQKIRSGSIFLFCLLLLMATVSIFHIVRLRKDARVILKNNYESLDYSHALLRYVDSASGGNTAVLQQFENILKQQEQNVTEPGEKEATQDIRKYFDQYKNGDRSVERQQQIRAGVQRVLQLNMAAIEVKNQRAAETANKAMTYLTMIIAIVFIVGLTFSFNFPAVITDPINVIKEGIQQVASRNYSHRIHLDRKDEFGEMANAYNEMASRLEYFENSNLNKILFEKARAEAVINSLRDASIGIDKNDIVLFANDQALQLLGLQARDIIGLSATTVASKNDLFKFLLQEKATVPFKIVVDNRENYFSKEVSEVNTEGNTVRLIVVKNITSFKELDVAKTNFIATISHELKTPLASSGFSIQLLQDERIGTLTDEQKEYVHSLKMDNQRMLKILSELLNMSQVEAGKIEMNMQLVAAQQVVQEAVATVLNSAREKNIKIETIIDDGLPLLMIDAEKTTWVLNNFLLNAIRYGGADRSIILKVSRNGELMRFSVADQGPGIPPEYISKVFDRFFKVPGIASSGTGIGLSISKEFIEAQKGRIWVKSEIGSGSIFGFDFNVEGAI